MSTEYITKRSRESAFKTTLRTFFEIRTSMNATELTTDGREVHVCGRRYSRIEMTKDKIIRTNAPDYLADVQKAISRSLKNASALERRFVADLLTTEAEGTTWLATHTTAEEFKKISSMAKSKVGLELLSCGIHPYALYTKPIDVR